MGAFDDIGGNKIGDNSAFFSGYCSADKEDSSVGEAISKNRWASIVYRRGQKQLARLFLREAEQALQLCLAEEC